MRKLNGWKMGCAVLCAAIAIAAPAQTFTTLASFDTTNGAMPTAGVIQGPDGNFYGITYDGGFKNLGVAYSVTSEGTLTRIHSFCGSKGCKDGSQPTGPLLLATDGDAYGTDPTGGAYGFGMIFKISKQGAFSVFYSFCAEGGDCPDGEAPGGGLIQAADGNFYGVTTQGLGNSGEVYKITPSGVLTVLHTFNSSDGSQPEAPPIQATDGKFYGTTQSGGTSPYGTAYTMTPDGQLTTLYNFCSQPACSDGAFPFAGLIQAADGNFYGTTISGGACAPENDEMCGTVFRISPAGALTTLYRFCSQPNCTDGNRPFAGLVQATDGKLYGTTESGGDYNAGTIFSIAPTGILTTLYSFCALGPPCVDGDSPYGELLQATNGLFYGTTSSGGTNCDSCGTVFTLNAGLGPFVTFVQPFGRIGQSIGILGQGFTGTTAVSLNGTPLNFNVVSDTYLTATVPSGATSGYVTVTTPTGVLTSNVPFRVIP